VSIAPTIVVVNRSINEWLHDADRAQGGADFAARMGDRRNADWLRRKAIGLYRQALAADPEMADPVWDEDDNQDKDWLRANGLAIIANRAPRTEGR
jgi:hypothetical protein